MRLQKRILTENEPQNIVLLIGNPHGAKIRMKAFDFDKPKTVYINRFLPQTKGIQPIRLPLPISPERLEIQFISDLDFEILEAHTEDVVFGQNYKFTEDIVEFLKLAVWFAENASYLEKRTYQNAFFKIVYLDVVRSILNYKPLQTVARVNRETAQIEVAQSRFDEMTVPMRFFILLHEFAHWYLQTQNEFYADRFGTELYLNLGFSKAEAIASLARLFDHNPSLNQKILDEQYQRAKINQEYIKKFKP